MRFGYWWATEARKHGARFDRHDDRYARTGEWLQVVNGMWSQSEFSFKGRYYQVEEAILEFEEAGLDLLLLQFSPQHEEMERFAQEVIPLVQGEGSEPVPRSRKHSPHARVP